MPNNKGTIKFVRVWIQIDIPVPPCEMEDEAKEKIVDADMPDNYVVDSIEFIKVIRDNQTN